MPPWRHHQSCLLCVCVRVLRELGCRQPDRQGHNCTAHVRPDSGRSSYTTCVCICHRALFFLVVLLGTQLGYGLDTTAVEQQPCNSHELPAPTVSRMLPRVWLKKGPQLAVGALIPTTTVLRAAVLLPSCCSFLVVVSRVWSWARCVCVVDEFALFDTCFLVQAGLFLSLFVCVCLGLLGAELSARGTCIEGRSSELPVCPHCTNLHVARVLWRRRRLVQPPSQTHSSLAHTQTRRRQAGLGSDTTALH